jgi:hypothetical protein
LAKLVNYNKRSIKLPPGYKDLLDVIKPPKRKATKGMVTHVMATQRVRIVEKERIATHGLDHLTHFTALILESRAKLTSLFVTVPGQRRLISVRRHREPEKFELDLLAPRDSEEERAIRAFFAARRIDHSVDFLLPDVHASSMRNLRYALPWEATAAANLIGDFLRNVHRLTDEVAVTFTVDKVEHAA